MIYWIKGEKEGLWWCFGKRLQDLDDYKQMVLYWISEKRVSRLIFKNMIILQELKGERGKN